MARLREFPMQYFSQYSNAFVWFLKYIFLICQMCLLWRSHWGGCWSRLESAQRRGCESFTKNRQFLSSFVKKTDQRPFWHTPNIFLLSTISNSRKKISYKKIGGNCDESDLRLGQFRRINISFRCALPPRRPIRALQTSSSTNQKAAFVPVATVPHFVALSDRRR